MASYFIFYLVKINNIIRRKKKG